MKEMYDEAFAELDAVETAPDAFDRIWLYVASGRRDEIADVIEELLSRETARIHPWALAVLGENDRAIERLRLLYEERNSFMLFANVDVLFDELRSDPRFRELMSRAGFPSAEPELLSK